MATRTHAILRSIENPDLQLGFKSYVIRRPGCFRGENLETGEIMPEERCIDYEPIDGHGRLTTWPNGKLLSAARWDGSGNGITAIPDVTEQEDVQIVAMAGLPGAKTLRRNFVEPVPVGGYVACVYRVVSYSPDCDGSALAKLEAVDRNGEGLDSFQEMINLSPDTEVVLDEPGTLWRLMYGTD